MVVMTVEGERPIWVKRITFVEVCTAVVRDVFESRHVVVCNPRALLEDGIITTGIVPRSTGTKHVSLETDAKEGKREDGKEGETYK